MFVIGEISVDDSVAITKFACDLQQCKGACCTFAGGRGAPLRDDEVSEIEKAFPIVETMLPEEHREVIRRQGLIDGTAGNYATQCVDGKACVFVIYDDGIAKCSIERAFFENKIAWRKPISCHLFPIRIGRNGDEIHYEHFSECAPALRKGERENIGVHLFAKDSLVREFGPEWTEQLEKEIDRLAL
jgi:Fe-S-cluster containining protein